MRKLFKVSTKAAIFSHDKTKVLVVHMSQVNDYGLPGGHIDEDEAIEQAMRRELAEECGIADINLRQAGFFMHSNGKLILAFVGQLAHAGKLQSQQGEQEGIPTWLTRDEFEVIDIEPNYKALVLENWN